MRLASWRYGVEEIAAAARKHGFALAVIPGDFMEDARLDEASTLPLADLRRIWAYFRESGPENIAACLDFLSVKIFGSGAAAAPKPVDVFGRYAPACLAAAEGAATALVLFYRSAFLAGDCAPVAALGRLWRAKICAWKAFMCRA